MRNQLYWVVAAVVVSTVARGEEAADAWPVRAEVVVVAKLAAPAKEALRQARSLDYAFVGRNSGDQRKAIAAYKQYLELAPAEDPSLVLSPMCRLAFLYANSFTPEKGERSDFNQATEWCHRVFAVAGRHRIVSAEITDLRKLYVTATRDPMERVRRIDESYRWQKGLSPDDVERGFAKCDRFGRYVGGDTGLRPSFPEDSRKTFESMVASVRSQCLRKLAETITCAKSVEVLGEIQRRFTDAELGRDLAVQLHHRKLALIDVTLHSAERIRGFSEVKDSDWTERVTTAPSSQEMPNWVGSSASRPLGPAVVGPQTLTGMGWRGAIAAALGTILAIGSLAALWLRRKRSKANVGA